jgi:hypothetical protein
MNILYGLKAYSLNLNPLTGFPKPGGLLAARTRAVVYPPTEYKHRTQ